ncbi:DUF488 domain-containing protein [Alienimonas californiensis]|uniref:DUF488 domain-containing protein n=1 Tax=Alienimonas californiensis TaxID=2527989 RepID=A0A517PDI2_9PLAN|nr:DUF488 domain-containing protein [Alienimonas californiensis]QDT17426.1 hypothetical protein CA12_35480 [Alienimonas californiensis]
MEKPPDSLLLTAGYTGVSVDRLIEVLLEHRVQRVVDVRELPLSRRAGFSKNGLAARLAVDDIGYTHLRPLGSPRDARKRFQADKDWRAFATAVNEHLTTAPAVDALEKLAELVADQRCCLLCTCPDADRCHRSLVADALADVTPVEVVHLTVLAD